MFDLCQFCYKVMCWIQLLIVCDCFPLLVCSAPPKVFNLKIFGDAREGSKVSASATVTGGAEGCSRVQWYKASSSEFKNGHELEALSTSKVSKVRLLLFYYQSTIVVEALLI